jgi:hypothetical protein
MKQWWRDDWHGKTELQGLPLVPRWPPKIPRADLEVSGPDTVLRDEGCLYDTGPWRIAQDSCISAPIPTLGVRFTAWASDFSLLHSIQTGSGTHADVRGSGGIAPPLSALALHVSSQLYPVATLAPKEESLVSVWVGTRLKALWYKSEGLGFEARWGPWGLLGL